MDRIPFSDFAGQDASLSEAVSARPVHVQVTIIQHPPPDRSPFPVQLLCSHGKRSYRTRSPSDERPGPAKTPFRTALVLSRGYRAFPQPVR